MHFKIVGNFYAGVFHHDRSRTILVRRELDCALHMLLTEIKTGNFEMQMNRFEGGWRAVNSFRGNLRLTSSYPLLCLLQDRHNIVGLATADTKGHQLHGSHAHISPATLRSTIKHYGVPTT